MNFSSVSQSSSNFVGNAPFATSSSSPASVYASFIATLQQNAGKETTVTQKDGSSVTTVVGKDGKPRVVSESKGDGTALTEVGYYSPVLLNGFLNSLFKTLHADGLSSPADGASATTAAGATDSDSSSVTSSVQTLMSQLTGNGTSDSNLDSLVSSYKALMQNTGVAFPDGTDSSATVRSSLSTFLQNALPSLKDGTISTTGINVDTRA